MGCKEYGPYAVDLPFDFGHFLLLAVFVGVMLGSAGTIFVLGKEREYGRKDHQGRRGQRRC